MRAKLCRTPVFSSGMYNNSTTFDKGKYGFVIDHEENITARNHMSSHKFLHYVNGRP